MQAFQRSVSCVFAQETVQGTVQLLCGQQPIVYDAILIQAEGTISVQASVKSSGLFESFYSSSKPIVLLSWDKELAGPGQQHALHLAFPVQRAFLLHRQFYAVCVLPADTAVCRLFSYRKIEQQLFGAALRFCCDAAR
eukprot:4945052-Pleurochrysis_carterae.AAC.7